jgi:hypothetical protein
VTTREVARASIGWAFGMSVTILLFSLWGRAVVIDTDTLAESLSPLAGTSIVSDMLGEWMADEMVEAGADPDLVEPTIDYYFQSSGVGDALDQLVVEMVYAAGSTGPEAATIDMAALVRPSVPELALGLSQMGYEMSQEEVAAIVAQFDPLVIRQPGADPIIGPSSPTASRLGTAALLALIAMIAFGAGFAFMSEDRIWAVKSLLTRVAVGGLSFAVFLRVGSWVLDPAGGRAPVQRTISELARSKWLVPLEVALVAAVAAGGIYFWRRRVRLEEVIQSPDGSPTPQPEQQQSLSGRR